jgi:hypothetical protein
MSDNFEKKIEEILNEDVAIPDSVLEKKEKAFNQIRKKKSKFLFQSKIAVAAITLVIIGGITFGNTAIAAIKNSLFNNDDGVQNAVDNGYIQNVDNCIMKDNGVEIKVNNVLRDSKRVALSLSLKFDDQDVIKYFKYIKLQLTIKNDAGEEIPLASNFSYSLDKETGDLVYDDVLDSINQVGNKDFDADNLKNTNNITLEIKKIELVVDSSADIDPEKLQKVDEDTKKQLEEAGVKLYKIIDGTWKTNITLDDKFKDSIPIEYKASQNNDYINIISAQMLPTGMDVTFNYKNQGDSLSEEVFKEIDEITLVDDKGITYKAGKGTSTAIYETDKTAISKTFSVTSFEKIGDLKMIIKDLNGNVQEIKLIKR